MRQPNFFRVGCDIIILLKSDFPEHSLDVPRREKHQHSDLGARYIGLCMRNTADGHRSASANIHCLFPDRDMQCTLQNDEMFILVIVDMHRYTVPGLREYLDHRLGAVGLHR
jgi:hypothetical protein